MTQVTDEYMREIMKHTKPYTLVILHKILRRNESDTDRIIWEHGRRNFELQRWNTKCCVSG